MVTTLMAISRHSADRWVGVITRRNTHGIDEIDRCATHDWTL